LEEIQSSGASFEKKKQGISNGVGAAELISELCLLLAIECPSTVYL
jgi:hypothetical protein